MRVLYLIPDFGKGGAERFLIDLCGALRQRSDVEFLIGSLCENDEYSPLTAALPIEQLNYQPFSIRRGGRCSDYERLLRAFKPDVVHTHRFLAEFLSGYYVSPATAYVCHCHDNMVQFAPATCRTLLSKELLANFVEKRWLIWKKYRKVRTAFIANSNHTDQYFRRVLPRFMRDDVHLIPYGFNFERFRRPAPAGRAAGERVRIVNVGSFVDKKNQALIVEIAAALRSMRVDFEIHLLGDGVNRTRVEDAVKRAGLEDRVLLHGNVHSVEEWLWQSHVYLHTAWYEPFGLVFLEAMAAGLPCVALDGKGNRDLIHDGTNGFLIQAQDPNVFAERIQELVSEPEKYRRLAANAQEYARAFDIAPAAEAFVRFYRSRTSVPI